MTTMTMMAMMQVIITAQVMRRETKPTNHRHRLQSSEPPRSRPSLKLRPGAKGQQTVSNRFNSCSCSSVFNVSIL